MEGGLTTFADDVFEKCVVESGTAEEAANMAVDMNSAFEAFTLEGGWTQNVEKMDVVTSLRKVHQNRLFPDLLKQ